MIREWHRITILGDKMTNVSLEPDKEKGAVFDCNGQSMNIDTREHQEEFVKEVHKRLEAKTQT